MTITESSLETPQESEANPTDRLQLPDLVIKGFRGLDDLKVSRLGRVTMITGKNSVGKTSVLEAIRIYAARGAYTALTNLLRGREEFADVNDEDGDSVTGINLAGLFHGWDVTDSSEITIGSADANNQLKIEVRDVTEEQLEFFGRLNPEIYELGNKMLSVRFNGMSHDLPWIFSFDDFAAPMTYRFDRRFPQIHRRLRLQQIPAAIPCATFGPGLPENAELADTWDKVTFKDDEVRALAALNIVLEDDIVRVATRGRSRGDPRLIADRRNQSRQFPLRAFGDGALRILGVALALVRSRDGFLLIDEAENGIHYSVQPKFWRMVLRTAHENNVQVVATTHSSDSVSSFAKAAIDNNDVAGELVRMVMHDANLYADLYSDEQVANAAKHAIDLR